MKSNQETTIRINKTYSIQKSVAGYLLEIEGLFFEQRQKKIFYFNGAANPLTAFAPLKKDVWLDFILSAIQNNYNNREECYFKPKISSNVINIYKIQEGSQTEISPSIKIYMEYTDNLQYRIDECVTFVSGIINEVNSKIRQLIKNEIQGHEYHDLITSLNKKDISGNLLNTKLKSLNDLIKKSQEIEANFDSSDMIPLVQALIADEINIKSKIYDDINSFELKEKTSESKRSYLNYYYPILFASLVAIFFLLALNIYYKFRFDIKNILK